MHLQIFMGTNAMSETRSDEDLITPQELRHISEEKEMELAIHQFLTEEC